MHSRLIDPHGVPQKVKLQWMVDVWTLKDVQENSKFKNWWVAW